MSDEIYYDEERNVIPMPLDEWKAHLAAQTKDIVYGLENKDFRINNYTVHGAINSGRKTSQFIVNAL